VKALILDGAGAANEMAGPVVAALTSPLTARGYEVRRHDLTALEIPECRGDFGCWTVTPGVCVQAGPHREIARDIVQSDLVAWLTPVTFGGYSSALKNQLDHCIPLVSPHFAKVDGETHHEPRYERFPSVLAVGLAERRDGAAAAVFERLVRRNALNMYAPHVASPIVTPSELADLPARAARWLDELLASRPPGRAAAPLDLGARPDLPAVPAWSALLLVGSPRGSASASAAISAHLAGLLREHGLTVSTEWIHRNVREDPELWRLAGALGAADVVVLATPLYVDSLPAPVTRALEVLARRRAAGARLPSRFLAIVNSGFPEAVHSDTALAICRQWAGEAGLDWIGGLGIGGGGMLAGRPLAELGGRARSVTRALALSADAIARGMIIPEEARRLAGTLPIPAWLYRFFGEWGFRQEAKKHGTRGRLGARPYAA
jgi:NAD(P)H-dependent FMN reductase